MIMEMDAVQNQRAICLKKKKKPTITNRYPPSITNNAFGVLYLLLDYRNLCWFFFLVFFCNPVVLGLLLKQIVTRPFPLL